MSKVRHVLVELTEVRIKEFLREPELLFWVFGFPLALALVLGFAFREKPPDRIPVGVIAGPFAEQRLKALRQSPVLLSSILSEEEGRRAMRRGKVSMLIGGDSPLTYHFDPTRPDARQARLEVDGALQYAAGRRNVLTAQEVRVSEVGSRYIDFLLPGLLGMNMMSTGMWGMGFTIVNARMKKLLKRLVATPMRKRDFLLAQFFGRLFFLVFEVLILVAFGWFVFHVRINGSLTGFALLCLVGGISFSGVGLLASSRARSLEAASGMMNIVMMPMWLFSGVFFSYERFPEKIKPLIRLLPLTALNDALRGVINDAMSLSEVVPQLLILAAWGLVSFVVGLRIFRWQ